VQDQTPAKITTRIKMRMIVLAVNFHLTIIREKASKDKTVNILNIKSPKLILKGKGKIKIS